MNQPRVEPLFRTLIVLFVLGFAFSARAQQSVTMPVAATGPVSSNAVSATTDVIDVVNFSGQLVERGTRKPLADTMVIIMETEESVFSDEKGWFEFPYQTPNTYTVIVAAVGYRKYQTTEVIEPTKRTEVVYYVDPQFISPYEIVVTGKREVKEVSRTTLSREELARVPGAAGDPVLAIKALPGISTPSGEKGDGMLVRGSSPGTNIYNYNRMPSYNLYHFGEIRSIFNGEMISNIDFLAGGHSAGYGDVYRGAGSGGVLDISTRDGRKDRLGGYLDVNIAMSEALIEGPVGSEDTTFAISGRRSYLDLILMPLLESTEEFEINTFPYFWDYQAQLTHRPNNDDRYSLFALGWRDELRISFETDRNEELEIKFDHTFHGVGANIDIKLGPDLYNYFTPYFNYYYVTFEFGSDYYVYVTTRALAFRDSLVYELNKAHTFSTGIDVGATQVFYETLTYEESGEGEGYSFQENLVQVPLRLDKRVYGYAAFIDDTITPNESWRIIPGMRMATNGINHQTTVEPRLSAYYQLTEATSLKSAWGIYHDYPELDQVTEELGTPGLKAEEVTHYIVGVEHIFSDSINLDVQLYYKDMRSMITAPPPDSEDDDNRGEGYSWGGEFFLRHNLVDRFFGWISYSYNKSRRNYGGGAYKVYDWDQPHTINIVSSYQLTREWELGARWSYHTGQPVTPVIGSTFYADSSEYLPVSGRLNSRRGPDYHRLDLRVDYKVIYDTWMIDYYLEVINAYSRNNTSEYEYNYDFSRREYANNLTFLPFLGVKASF
jgi:CarboxypepD_reg-like domain